MKKKKRFPLWFKIVNILCVIVIFCIIGVAYYYNHILDSIHYKEKAHSKYSKEKEEAEKIGDINSIPDVTNILCIGEEAIESKGSRGRTDAMILLTLNKKTKELKMTSFMRDLYVDIPDYKYGKNRLNAAYELGDINCLYDTLAKNFQIIPDGYVHVGFQDFEKLIDKLGGIEISLTAAEAKYLNSTNYISKRKYRTVKEGLQTLNGNQALGYARVRKVRTAENERDDYGRTSRQRKVLNAIFEKYKSVSLPKMLKLLSDTAACITTDISKEDIKKYLKLFTTLDIKHLDTLRIPVDGGFYGEKVYIGNSRRKSEILVPDLDINISALDHFINNSSSTEPTDTPVQR